MVGISVHVLSVKLLVDVDLRLLATSPQHHRLVSFAQRSCTSCCRALFPCREVMSSRWNASSKRRIVACKEPLEVPAHAAQHRSSSCARGILPQGGRTICGENGGRSFLVGQAVIPTPDKRLLRIDLAVRGEGAPATAHLTFIRRAP